jgi:hypothetical protein
LLLPQPEGEGVEIRRAIDALGGIEDPESIRLEIAGDEIAALLRKRRRFVDSAELVNNNVSAGDDMPFLVVASNPTEWPSADGTVYLGNQTITYTAYGNRVMAGSDRGRYAILDSNLDEVKWKPRIEWDESLQTPPFVTLYPQRMIGRVITLYRNFFDPISGEALPKSESEIRFRGAITTYGDAGNGIGVEIGAISAIDMLNSEAFAEQPEYELKGYGVRDGTSSNKHDLILYESEIQTAEDGPIATSLDIEILNKIPKRITIDLTGINTVDELIKEVQTQMDLKHTTVRVGAFKPLLDCPWKCERGPDGNVIIGAAMRGMLASWVMVNPGDTRAGVGADIYALKGATGVSSPPGDDLIMRLLGFDTSGGIDSTWSHTAYGKFEWQMCKHSFAMYTNPSDPTWSGYILPEIGNQELLLQVRAENPPARVAWHNTRSFALPVDLSSSYKTLITAPGDRYGKTGGCLVHVDDQVVYEADDLDVARSVILLLNPKGNVDYPIGSRVSPKEEVVLISEGDTENKYVRQAWQPTNEQKVTMVIGGSSYKETRRGVEYFLLQTMLSTGSLDEYNGIHDILHGGWGLEIPEEYVDVDSFTKIGDYHTQPARDRDYLWTKPFDFLEILEAECKTLGIQVVMRAGKITAQPIASATYAQVSWDITDANRLDDSGVTWQASPEGLINQISFNLDFDVIDEEFRTHEVFINLASAVDAQRIEKEEIDNRGIRALIWKRIPQAPAEVKIAMMDRLWRLSRESYIYECDVTRDLDTAAVGDIATVTDSRIINPATGVRGIIRHLATIEEITFDDLTGRGTVLVRVRYDWDETYTPSISVANPSIDNVNFAPAIILAKGFNPGSILPYIKEYSPDNVPVFLIGAQIVVTDLETGEKQETTVTGFDAVTQEIQTADPIEPIDTEGIVTFQKHSNQIASGSQNELESGYIANPDGKIDGTQRGYKVVI